MKKEIKQELEKQGYFFHPGGDFPQEINNPKKRGIWKTYDSPIGAKYIGTSWKDAETHNERFAF